MIVAVVDSGLNPGHPHLSGAVIGDGIAIAAGGREDDDWVDRLGHGTAVAAVIHEKAPDVTLLPIRVFGDTLATGTDVLARAIEWAADRGARLVNLSLGTANAAYAPVLRKALDYAAERSALVVSPCAYRDTEWLPGALPGAIGVVLDWDRPRDSVAIVTGPAGRPVLAASGYPRPVPGVPPERNLKGISFAAANATGVLARALEGRAGVREPGQVFDLLRSLRPATPFASG